jgi:shikimate dehydrogenase
LNKKLFALFGNPVSHSKSPLLHNSLFKHLAIGACYTRYLLQDGNLLKEKFLSLGLDGINITVPFKEDAYSACDELDGYAKSIGAVNTIVLRDGKLHGFNTDAPGFIASLEGFLPVNALILGAGGTARALVFALRSSGVDVVVANRSEGRLEFFRQNGFETTTFDMLDGNNNFELIINTTSAGLSSDELPCEQSKLVELLSKTKFAYDCIYHETLFLKMAKELDKKHKNGLDMLICQAFFAFELFIDKEIDKKMIGVMKEAVL